MMRSMQARVFGGAVAWIGGTVTATALSLLAVSALGHGMAFGGTQTLSSDQVARALAAATASASPSTTASPSAVTASPTVRPSPGGTGPSPSHRPAGTSPVVPAPGQDAGSGSAFSSAGGTVFARCTAAGAYLTSWSPAQGYQAAQVVRGPAEHVAVRFVSGGSGIVLHVECSGGQPQSWVSHAFGDDGSEPGDH